jgi:hypothetical protein
VFEVTRFFRTAFVGNPLRRELPTFPRQFFSKIPIGRYRTRWLRREYFSLETLPLVVKARVFVLYRTSFERENDGRLLLRGISGHKFSELFLLR